MLKVAICDDERIQVNILMGYLDALSVSYPTLEYDIYFCGKELLEHYQKVKMEDFYDIIFLDIEMEHCDGMDIAKAIREIDENVFIAYATRHNWLALDGYQTKVNDFLVKPVVQEKFNNVFRRAYQDIVQKDEVFCFNYKHEHIRLFTDKIMYFYCYARNIEIHTTDGLYEMTSRTKPVYERLNKDTFLMIHHSFIVNMKHIRIFKRGGVVLQNGEELDVSPKKAKETKKVYEQFVTRRIL